MAQPGQSHASTKGGCAMDQPRKPYRSHTNRRVAGVCGGLGEYFNIDATLIRVLFVVFTVFGGAGLIIYLAMWIIVPNASTALPPT
jgi:phage shock protein C